MNTTRGRAAEAIRNLIIANAEYLQRFHATLGRLVRDKSISVRFCAASTLLAVVSHDAEFAFELFANLDLTDDRLFASQYIERLIYHGLRKRHFAKLRPCIERMLRSTRPKVSEVGARLASLAVLYKLDAADLVREAVLGSPSQRLGVAQVASSNIHYAECRAWCEKHLLTLFSDDSHEVRRESASCFRNLKGEQLEAYEDLIIKFCDSAAYKEDSFSILYALEDSVYRLPGITCLVCEKFLDRFSDDARDIRTGRAGDVRTAAKLIFRTYHQHQHDEWGLRCLDLIDRMCLEGIHDARSEMDEYER